MVGSPKGVAALLPAVLPLAALLAGCTEAPTEFTVEVSARYSVPSRFLEDGGDPPPVVEGQVAGGSYLHVVVGLAELTTPVSSAAPPADPCSRQAWTQREEPLTNGSRVGAEPCRYVAKIDEYGRMVFRVPSHPTVTIELDAFRQLGRSASRNCSWASTGSTVYPGFPVTADRTVDLSMQVILWECSNACAWPQPSQESSRCSARDQADQ